MEDEEISATAVTKRSRSTDWNKAGIGIYQIRDDSAVTAYVFGNMNFIESHGLQVRKEDYKLVYCCHGYLVQKIDGRIIRCCDRMKKTI